MKNKKLPEVAEQKNIAVKLKISRGRLEDLVSIMPFNDYGRFGAIKSEVRREIQETPEDQFAIVHGSSEMLSNKKERAAAYTALRHIVPKEWVIRWSAQARGFLLVRRSNWVKIKQSKRNGEVI